MSNLEGLRIFAPPDPEDHAIVTDAGTVYAVAVNEPEYTVGEIDGGMIGFGPGTWLPASGLSYPQASSKGFELVVLDRLGRGRKRRVEGLVDALPFARELWRPDGLMLPLARAASTGVTQGQIDALVYPRGPVWQHPLLDRLTTPATYAAESVRDVAPVVNVTPNTPLRAPLAPAKMPTGTLMVGIFCDDPLLYSVASLGNTITPEGRHSASSIGIYFSLGSFFAHVGDTRAQAFAPTSKLRLFALAWGENRGLRFYSQSDEGFIEHANVALGAVPTFGARELSLATISGVGGVEGAFMPGASRLGDGAPFATHNAMTEPQIRAALGPWYQHLNAYSAFTPGVVTPALTVDQPAAVQLVLGLPQEVRVTVRRLNGLRDPITLTAAPDDIALRTSPLVEIVDTDLSSDIFKLTLTPESGLTLGDHTVTFTATTAAGLRSSVTLQTRVLASAPGLPAGTTHFWPVYDPVTRLPSKMADNTVTTGGDLVMGGLTRFSSAFDAVIGDGSDIAPFGPSVVTVDNCVASMAAVHTVSWTFWDVNLLPVNSVLFSVASQTNKFDFWQVYKDAAGLKLRVSKGTSTQTASASSQSLVTPAGVLHLSVKVSATSVTLENPTIDQTATLTNPGLAGAGRLTLFGTKLADLSVQGLSQGVALVGAVQNVLVN